MMSYLIVRDTNNNELCKKKIDQHYNYWWGSPNEGFKFPDYLFDIARAEAILSGVDCSVIKKTALSYISTEETLYSHRVKVQEPYIHKNKSGKQEPYVKNCYKCGSEVSSEINTRCKNCRWYICTCGACGCNR